PAEQVVERPVLQHQDEDVLYGHCTCIVGERAPAVRPGPSPPPPRSPPPPAAPAGPAARPTPGGCTRPAAPCRRRPWPGTPAATTRARRGARPARAGRPPPREPAAAPPPAPAL